MVAAGIEGGSLRRVRQDWNLQDYARQCDYWRSIGGPPHLVQIAMAEALGVKFQREGVGRFVPDADGIQPADPLALQALFGQSEPLPYVAPRRGLIIDPGGQA